MLLMIFKNLIKLRFLKIVLKNLSFEENQIFECLMFFTMARPVCIRLYFDLIKHFSQKPFIFRNVLFLHFQPKNEEVKENFSKTTTKLLSMYM